MLGYRMLDMDAIIGDCPAAFDDVREIEHEPEIGRTVLAEAGYEWTHGDTKVEWSYASGLAQRGWTYSHATTTFWRGA